MCDLTMQDTCSPERGELMGEFRGFTRPTSKFFRMPNEWTDITADISSLAELKVIEYVLRHTWGFNEFGKVKDISIDEFMYGRRRSDDSRMDKGTGLSNHSVIAGLKLAIEHGYLVCEIDTSDLARIKKSYALRMFASEKSSPHEESTPDEISTPSSEESSLPAYEESSLVASEESTQRSEERHSLNTFENTLEEKQEESGVVTPDNYPVSSSVSSNLTSELIVSLSEKIRGEQYTLSERKQQMQAAMRMLQGFPELTQTQFEQIFRDWSVWWASNGKGHFSLVHLMKSQGDGTVRLKASLDRLQQPPKLTVVKNEKRRVSPNSTGQTAKIENEIAQRNIAELLA